MKSKKKSVATKGAYAPKARELRREELARRFEKHDLKFQKLIKSDDLRIHMCMTLKSQTGPYLDKILFIGVNAIFCKQGIHRLTFTDHEPVIIKADECLVVFPGHIVGFEALDTTCENIITCAVLAGSFAEEFAASIGYYDFLKTPCVYPTATLDRLQMILETKDLLDPKPRNELLGLFQSMLLYILELAKTEGDAFFFDAIRIINHNVAQGQCRLAPICKELGISRNRLHHIFAHAGLKSAGAYVKDLQYRFAMKLLRVSRLSVAEIAYRVGFASPTQFSAFIRQRSGKPPIAHRGKD